MGCVCWVPDIGFMLVLNPSDKNLKNMRSANDREVNRLQGAYTYDIRTGDGGEMSTIEEHVAVNYATTIITNQIPFDDALDKYYELTDAQRTIIENTLDTAQRHPAACISSKNYIKTYIM